MPKTADQMATNWQQGMQNPSTAQKYKQGIGNFQGNPMALAASPEATALYLSRIQMAVSSGKRANKLNAVPVERWRNNAMNIGANLLSSGANKAIDKVRTHFQKWAPIYQQASAAAHALPKGGEANALARVQAAIHTMMVAAGTA